MSRDKSDAKKQVLNMVLTRQLRSVATILRVASYCWTAQPLAVLVYLPSLAQLRIKQKQCNSGRQIWPGRVVTVNSRRVSFAARIEQEMWST